MAYEVFNNTDIYTEVDTQNNITVDSSSKVSYSTIGTTETSYFYSDKGVNHFAGSFEHLFGTNSALSTNKLVAHWIMTNDLGTITALDAANKSHFRAVVYNAEFYLQERDGSSFYSYRSTTYYTAGVTYYHKMKRDEGTGTYGTLYDYIYSDAARTTLVWTLTLALHSSKKDFQYICPIVSHASRPSPDSGYVENLDLQEGGAPTQYDITVSDGITLSDTPVRKTTYNKSIADSFDLSDVVSAVRKFIINVADSIDITDVISKLARFGKTIADTIGLTDIITSLASYLVD